MISVLPSFHFYPTKKHLWSGLSSWVLGQHARELKPFQVDGRPWKAMCIPLWIPSGLLIQKWASQPSVRYPIRHGSAKTIPELSNQLTVRIERVPKRRTMDDQHSHSQKLVSDDCLKSSSILVIHCGVVFQEKLTNVPCIDVLPTKKSERQAFCAK